MNRVNEKLDAVEREKGEREYRERQCRLFLRTVTNLSQVATDDVKNARQGESMAQEDAVTAAMIPQQGEVRRISSWPW